MYRHYRRRHHYFDARAFVGVFSLAGAALGVVFYALAALFGKKG